VPSLQEGDTVRIARLSKNHRSALEEFLGQLDSPSTYDYTHFGYRIDNPVETADKIYRENAAGNCVGYVILDKKRILGFGHLDFFSKREKRHVVKLGIILHHRHQGKGLGRRLLDSIIADAKRRGIEKIWLATYADNHRALQLYLTGGFVVEGVFRKEEKVRGRYRDVISMALFLKEPKDRD
jgi:RimJ/RimL family protein N-acetyltransferase